MRTSLSQADMRRFRTLRKAQRKKGGDTARLRRLIDQVQRRLNDQLGDAPLTRRQSDARAASRKRRRKMQQASRRRNR